MDNMAGGEEKTEGRWVRIRNLCDTCREKCIVLNPDKFHIGRSIELGGFAVERKIPKKAMVQQKSDPKPTKLTNLQTSLNQIQLKIYRGSWAASTFSEFGQTRSAQTPPPSKMNGRKHRIQMVTRGSKGV